MSEDRMCYIARVEGQPGCFAACADMKEHPKDTARFVAEHVRKGHIVERVTSEKARDMLGQWLKWDQEHGKRAEKKKQSSLFAASNHPEETK